MSLNTTLKSLITGLVFAGMLFTVSCNHKDNEINATCFDEVLNQDEERVDCGGPNCPPCPPTCDDGILNQDEQYIDCGGPNCPECGNCNDLIQNEVWVPSLNAFVMEQGVDCGFPCPGYCPPSCENGEQDGDETGIDCGGSMCDPCPPPTCSDGVWNGLETGVDCGGPDCQPCPVPSCFDGIQNQNETGIDCGGICPNDCPTPTCFDGIQNQGEQGVDCGPPCPTLCPPESCNDGVWNNGEEWIDCGPVCENVCPTCFDGVHNGPEAGMDCIVGDVPGYVDADGNPCPQCETCFDGFLNNDETYFDCGGPNCDPCVMWLDANALGGISGGPFVGVNFNVQQMGFDIIFTATQTVSGVTRTLKIRVPSAMDVFDVEPIDAWVGGGGGPAVEYTNFSGVVFQSVPTPGSAMEITFKQVTDNPKHIEGNINAVLMENVDIITGGTTGATNITFFINYN